MGVDKSPATKNGSSSLKEPGLFVETIAIWRDSLRKLLHLYEECRGRSRLFYLYLFVAFVFLNIFFFWLALRITYPNLLNHYIARSYVPQFRFVQIPIGVLGGVFDFLSFFVTIWVVRRALRARSTVSYLGHLSIDILIAVIATFWVVYVMVFSFWIYNLVYGIDEGLLERQALYEERIRSTVDQPEDNWRNLLFGFLLGFSAMFPTVTHLISFILSFFKAWWSPGLSQRLLSSSKNRHW